jgi:hypothetical protein
MAVKSEDGNFLFYGADAKECNRWMRENLRGVSWNVQEGDLTPPIGVEILPV